MGVANRRLPETERRFSGCGRPCPPLTVLWQYGKLARVKTTVEIPDELFREAKARAALTGGKLKDLVAEGLRRALASSPPGRLAASRSAARKRGESASAPVPVRPQGRLAITGEVVAELDDEDLVRGAFGGRYRLRHAPVKVSEGNEIRPLTNEEMARLFEAEDTLRAP